MSFQTSGIDGEVYAFLSASHPSTQSAIMVGVHRDGYQVKGALMRLVRSGLVSRYRERFLNARGQHGQRTMYTIVEDAHERD